MRGVPLLCVVAHHLDSEKFCVTAVVRLLDGFSLWCGGCVFSLCEQTCCGEPHPPSSSCDMSSPTSRRLRRQFTPDRSQSRTGTQQLPVFSTEEQKQTGKKGKKKLGMFKGVLVPTCENMWGVIIFLRFYVIVGYAGLGWTIFIVTLSFSVALLTALALSAIATCGTSHSLAGVYPMLARALGKEIATATGLVYFLGIVCLAVLECLGACEELFQVAPELADMGGARLWGFIFLCSLSLMVGGGIKIVSAIGIWFFVVVIVTLSFLYVSLLAAPNLVAADAPDTERIYSAIYSASGSADATSASG
jgi:hypothetical protein